ncbi:hypothetical protein [Rheinheimera baltica]|uniref:Uncharacterized protein n=1 Tax=Rheinheimera baltica TaxID=67576 RepID=A0ABT9I178_9GAMM|nr:hypothetical protein [Rheinheimera baltica]MDP5137129.1 hypothetical protein [Rheinheimera baltica]MDP5192158.1 hypothetical protein [Rheinheimera baltica]
MNLTEDEKWLMMDLTDFNKSFKELVENIHFEHLAKSASEKFAIAEKLVVSLIDKELLQLSRSKYKKDSRGVLCLLKSDVLATSEVIHFMKHPSNWMSDHGLEDESIYFELSPTELGEKQLDILFGISNGN